MFTFVRKVIAVFAQYHRIAEQPLKLIHLGGDEIPRGTWGDSPACRNLTQSYGADSEGKWLTAVPFETNFSSPSYNRLKIY